MITDELPIYVVSGANWRCEIQLDEDDSEIPVEEQVVEAITKAIETVKGINNLTTIEITDDDSEPYLGPVMHAHLKGTNPDNGHFVASFVALGNAGLYKESKIAQAEWIREFQAAAEIVKAQNEKQEKNKKDLKNFDSLKEDLKKIKRKRGRPPLK